MAEKTKTYTSKLPCYRAGVFSKPGTPFTVPADMKPGKDWVLVGKGEATPEPKKGGSPQTLSEMQRSTAKRPQGA